MSPPAAKLRRFSGHDGPVNVVAFAPDGRTVISGGADGTGLVWDVSELQEDRPAGEPLAPGVLKAHWDELAGADARAAHRATWRLGVPSAVPFLREHLRPAAMPDPKGVPSASGPIAPPGILRSLRAIAALEYAGTPAARAAIELMANGHPAAIETREAKAALDRLRIRRQITSRFFGPSVRHSARISGDPKVAAAWPTEGLQTYPSARLKCSARVSRPRRLPDRRSPAPRFRSARVSPCVRRRNEERCGRFVRGFLVDRETCGRAEGGVERPAPNKRGPSIG